MDSEKYKSFRYIQDESTDNKNKENFPKEKSSQEPIGEQVLGHAMQKQIHVDFDERNLRTCYANVFRTTATGEEAILDFGLNYVEATGQQTGRRKMVLHANERIVTSYYSAKRLTLTLSQIIRRHEQESGEIELEAAKRRLRNSK